MRTEFAKPLYGLKPVSRVRIPPSPCTSLMNRCFFCLTRPTSARSIGSVHDDHARPLFSEPPVSRFVQIALPSYFAFQSTDGALSVCINQQSQTCFHRGLLGTRSTVPHSLTHQAIIDFNIRAQRDTHPMCAYLIVVCMSQGGGRHGQ